MSFGHIASAGLAAVTDRLSLGPRVRHFFEEGDCGDEALVAEYLEWMVELLFELSDQPGEAADALFQLAMVLSTLRGAFMPDGATKLQVVVKKRPHTAAGGRQPDSFELIWRKHEAARIAEASQASNQEERIGEALAAMREKGRAKGLTLNGIKSILTARRKDREARESRGRKKTP